MADRDSKIETSAPPDAILNARTLAEIVSARVALTPDRVAYRRHDRAGRWADWSWLRVGEEFLRWRNALAAEW